MGRKKALLYFFGALVLFGGSFFFRERISELLRFESPGISQSGTGDEIGKRFKPANQEPFVQKEEESKPDNPTVPHAKTPPYVGRDPGEYRPAADEMRVFSEEQKIRVFSSIQTHASAVKSDPSYFNGWIQIGILKKIIGDFEGARDAWEYAGIIQPLNSLSFANLGELYWRYLHDYKKSEQNLRISIKHKPDDIQTYVTLAELYHYSYTEKADLADDVLLEGIQATGHGTLMRRLAYLYEQRNELPKALEWWEKVLAANPGDSEVKAKIDTLKSKIGGTPSS